MKKTDELFNIPKDRIEPFSFGREVAEVFDDMAERSIPCYNELQNIAAELAKRFYRPGTLIYDLGCSTGNTTARIIESFNAAGSATPAVVAVDSSVEMVDIAKMKCGERHVRWLCSGIQGMSFPDASVIVAAYVLQFIDPGMRQSIVNEMYRGLERGGILILAEKMRSDDGSLEPLMTDLYHDFKRRMGYSDLEIQQKASALEGVLIPFSPSENEALLRNAGFTHVETFLKSFNFTCLLALK